MKFLIYTIPVFLLCSGCSDREKIETLERRNRDLTTRVDFLAEQVQEAQAKASDAKVAASGLQIRLGSVETKASYAEHEVKILILGEKDTEDKINSINTKLAEKKR